MAVNFLSQIDPNTMLLGSFFIIALMFFLWTLGRVIKDNNAIKTVISFTLALLSTWGLSRSNINLSNFAFSLGISEEMIYLIAPILFIGFLFIIGLKRVNTGQTGANGKPIKKRKFSFSRMLIVLGILMIAGGISELAYQREVLLYGGVIITIIGFILSSRAKKKESLNSSSNEGNYREIEKERNKLIAQYHHIYRKAKSLIDSHNGNLDSRQFPSDAKVYTNYIREMDKIEKIAIKKGIRLR